MEPMEALRGIRPPRFQDGRFEIAVEPGGRLPLPPGLVQSLGLGPGDIVALEPVTEAWKIRFYRQILTFPHQALSPGIRWSFTAELLRLPLTALDETGAIAIPPEVLPLSVGDRLVLRLLAPFGSWWPDIYLTAPPAAGTDLAKLTANPFKGRSQ